MATLIWLVSNTLYAVYFHCFRLDVQTETSDITTDQREGPTREKYQRSTGASLNSKLYIKKCFSTINITFAI